MVFFVQFLIKTLCERTDGDHRTCGDILKEVLDQVDGLPPACHEIKSKIGRMKHIQKLNLAEKENEIVEELTNKVIEWRKSMPVEIPETIQ